MMDKITLRRRADTLIPILGFSLSLVGLVMILSASQIMAADRYENAYYFFFRQLTAWMAGLAAFFFFLTIPIEVLYQNRSKLLLFVLISLVLVFVPVIGPRIANVHRWIDLGFFKFQPAELAKLLLLIYFSGFFAARSSQMNDPVKVLTPFIVVLLIIGGLVMLEPDMGTMLVITTIAMAVFFAARANLIQYISLCIAGVVVIIGLISAAPYRAERLAAYLGMVNDNADTLGSAYHTHQALIAIGSGGIWGVGFGQGMSKYSYLPQAHTDSIFAVIAEELGFIRTTLILAAYLLLCWRGLRVARQANSRFVQLIAVGISTMFIVQAIINVSGMLGVLPLTGVPLPFISYGGSSLIVSLGALGLLTNASREVQ